jgi:hypothetical protein
MVFAFQASLAVILFGVALFALLFIVAVLAKPGTGDRLIPYMVTILVIVVIGFCVAAGTSRTQAVKEYRHSVSGGRASPHGLFSII